MGMHMRMKDFESLSTVRDKFIDPDEVFKNFKKEVGATVRNMAVKTKYADHGEFRQRDAMIQELLQLAISHVVKLNSHKTALTILGRASNLAQNRQTSDNAIQKHIIKAGDALRSYIKLNGKRYASSRKFSPTAAKSHWIEKFNEAMQEAILAVQVDIDKREGTFFNNLVKNASTDLPLSLHEKKKVTYAETPVIVNLKGSAAHINKTVAYRVIEGRLVLLAKANLIGINTTRSKPTKGIIEQANRYASKKYGATVYPQAVARPSKNILWFLVLDFGTNITSAVFPEDMALTDAVSGVASPQEAATLADYVNQFNVLREKQRILNLENQKTARVTFERDFDYIYEDIKVEKRKLEALLEGQALLAKEFASLTSMSGEEESGLAIKQYHTQAFDDFFTAFMREQVIGSPTANKTRLAVLEQRLHARYTYYCCMQVARAASQCRAVIKGITARLERMKQERRSVA